MPDPFVKRQAKEKQEAQKAITAESFRAKEAQSLTKSIGTAGKPLVEPRQKEDKVATTAFTPSVDMSSGGDDDKSKPVEISTTATATTYKYTEQEEPSFLSELYDFGKGVVSKLDFGSSGTSVVGRTIFTKGTSPVSSTDSKLTDKLKKDLLDPNKENPLRGIMGDRSSYYSVLNEIYNNPSFAQQYQDTERTRAIFKRKTSENNIRNTSYDLLTKNFGLSPQTAQLLTNVVDFSPVVGDFAGFEDAVINYKSGRYKAAAFDAALATIGLAPIAGNAIRKALNGIDIKDLTPQMFSTRPLKKFLGLGKGGEIAKNKAIKNWQKFLEEQNLTDVFTDKDIMEVLPDLPTAQKNIVMSKLDELYVKTGWNPSIKNKFVTEIDDFNAELLNNKFFDKESIKQMNAGNKKGVTKTGVDLDSLIYHEELFKIYPELRGMKVYWTNSPKSAPAYYVARSASNKNGYIVLNSSKYEASNFDNEEMLENVLHEIQHSVQDLSGITLAPEALSRKVGGISGEVFEFEHSLNKKIAFDRDRIIKIKKGVILSPNKIGELKFLENRILINRLKLDNYRSRLSFNPRKTDLSEKMVFASSYYKAMIEAEARNVIIRKNMDKKFLKSPFRTIDSLNTGYSGFDVILQASKDKSGVVDPKVYNDITNKMINKISTFVDEKFSNTITSSDKEDIIKNIYADFVYKRKTAVNLASDPNKPFRVNLADYTDQKNLMNVSFNTGFEKLKEINDEIFNLFKNQINKTLKEQSPKFKGDYFTEETNDNFIEYLKTIEKVSPSIVPDISSTSMKSVKFDELTSKKDSNYSRKNINVPVGERTPFDDIYTVTGSDTTFDINTGLPSKDFTENISTNPASPLEIGVNKFNVDNIENPMLIKNYTKSNLIETEEFVKNSNKSTAGGGAKDLKINVPIEEGSDVAVRLNLSSRIDNTIKEIKDKPNLSNRLQTIHPVKNGVPNYNKSQSYMPYVTVENGKFDVNQNNRSKIVKTGDKNPAASVLGKYTTSRNIFDEMDDTVVEIGINPKMLHLFVNLKTGQAVKDFELATIFRDRVYAKGVTYWKKVEAPEPTQGTSSEVRYANKKGGLISSAN